MKYDFSIDDYTACDIFDVMNSNPEWPRDEFIQKIIIDMLEKDVEREVKEINLLIERIFTTMLIYKYIKDIQNGRMVLILWCYSERLNDFLGTRDCLEKRLDPDTCYSKAILNANKINSEYKYSLSNDDRSISNIRNRSYILNFISNYAYSEKAINVYNMIMED